MRTGRGRPSASRGEGPCRHRGLGLQPPDWESSVRWTSHGACGKRTRPGPPPGRPPGPPTPVPSAARGVTACPSRGAVVWGVGARAVPAGPGAGHTRSDCPHTSLLFPGRGPGTCLRLARPPPEPGRPLSWEPPPGGPPFRWEVNVSEPGAPGRAGRGVRRPDARCVVTPLGARGLSPGGPDHVPGASSPPPTPQPGAQHAGLSHSRATGTDTRHAHARSSPSSHSHPHAHARP